MQSPDGHMATRRLPSNAEDEIIPMSTAAVNVSVDVAAAAATAAAAPAAAAAAAAVAAAEMNSNAETPQDDRQDTAECD